MHYRYFTAKCRTATGRCHPTVRSAMSPAVLRVYPLPPTGVPERAAASTHDAAAPGGLGGVRSAKREGGGTPESMGGGRGGREQAAGE